MVDLHCHIVPYVDDGAANLDVALDLLTLESEQGVKAVCCTPHLRDEMFMTPDEKVRHSFLRLRDAAREEGIPLALCLSREYFYDENFIRLLKEGRVCPMGRYIKTLLVEFSYYIDLKELQEAAQLVLDAGYRPLFAHVERYEAFQKDPIGCAAVLKDMGVLLQLNADGVLGLEGWRLKRVCKRLLKNRMIDVIASDAHDLQFRPSNLEKCKKHLEKKYGEEYAWQLLHTTPLSVLQG